MYYYGLNKQLNLQVKPELFNMLKKGEYNATPT